ncbi:SAF domain-containing protein [Kribbella shirazensis]|uniref:Flp pilus assembly protein CpaB n=1 Tax=Kribbella shirazensis TaxID=1105143 RepID=A0A7X5V905_9ACTN|nr:SAF domain-containing protein [Kribbella shirazensis]NIK56844.1 Flp pilus assembly protein CpaB [Kribbella shirazensis]
MKIPSLLRDLFRAARWHRRLLAGVAAAAAVYFGLLALSPAPPPTVTVLAAARDLTGGAAPARDDLRTIELPPGSVPDGALRPGSELTTRVLSGPVRSGEPLTDARFLAPPAVPSGALAYPVRIDDPDITSLLRVGDHLNLYAASSTTADAAGLLARAVPVLALPEPRSGTSGALIVVAATPEVASRLAQASTNSRITVALTPDTG